MNVQSLLENVNPWTDRQNEASKLVSKWDQTGLLKNLSSETDRNNMAVILENQAKALVQEANVTGGQAVNTGAGEAWAGVALPLVRRVFGEIVAKEFVSVQPMSLPSGLVFYLDFQYANTTGVQTAAKSLYGNQADSHPNVKNLDVADGLYGAGKFGYSINSASVATATGSRGTATLADFNYDSAVSASEASSGAVYTVSVPTSSLDSSFDKLAVRSFMIESGSITAANVLQEYTKLSGDNVVFTLKGGLGVAATSNGVKVTYSLQPTQDARGDFEDTTGNLVIPSVDIKLKSEAIVAKTRKLKAQWTPEFAQDLNAYHSIDAEAEITSMISNYIAMEVDLEILDMLIDNAATTGYWSAVNNEAWNGSSFAALSSGYYNTQGGWFQTLGTVLQQVSNKIHQKTLRGGANFVVVSPSVATILESIPGFAADGDGEKSEFNFGIQKMGSLNSRYKVYKNPYLTGNTILMGYKGSQFLETGAVYAPYIPLIMTPLVYDPTTFTPRKGLMTRYAKKMVRPEFYGKVYVKGLETLGY